MNQIAEIFPFCLQLVEVILQTTANPGEALIRLVQKNMRVLFALYRIKFDIVFQKL